MSIINNLKAMLGFPDKEDMGNENSSQTNSPSYINPFKKENEKPLPPPVPEVAKISQKDVEDAISDEVVDKVTSVLNTSLPEYVRECIDKDAQANYVRSLIGSTLTDFLQQIKQEAEEAARQQWQKDRMDLANKSSEASKQMNEYKTKNEELRNRILSLDRQKTTLNDRISTLENRAASAEAEREQYQLECKSLMNKIKVAAVNDEALQALRQDNDDLRAETRICKTKLPKSKPTPNARPPTRRLKSLPPKQTWRRRRRALPNCHHNPTTQTRRRRKSSV